MIIDSPKEYNDYEKYVNHELSVDLDSTHAFEGPEKLLEIWFSPNKNALPLSAAHDGLRSVPRTQWEEMLDIVKCKVLSTVSSSEMDAYLLSESSMFVFPHKLILKTCGTTTTLIGIPRIMELAAEFARFPKNVQPWRVFYSRKSFMFPELQLHPHRSWEDEVKYLDSVFDNGGSYMVGNLRAGHWHLYTTDADFAHVPNHVESFEDETLEVLMTDLSPRHAAQFFTNRLPGAEKFLEEDYCGISDSETSISSSSTDSTDPGHELGSLVTKHAKINKIFPGVSQSIDSFGFTPCGYSCNAIVDNDHYFTIHVTPEPGFSYASFESNVPVHKYGMTSSDVLARVVDIFKPGKFSLTLFEASSAKTNSVGAAGEEAAAVVGHHNSTTTRKLLAHLDGYKRTDRILYEFDGYDLVFISFEAIKSN